MIVIKEINKQTDLFEPTATNQISFLVLNLASDTSQEHEMLIHKASKFKTRTYRTETIRVLKALIKQREVAYQYNETLAPQDKWEAILKLNDRLMMLSRFQELKPFYNYVDKHITYLLGFIMPSQNSRYRKNYELKLNLLKAFIKEQKAAIKRLEISSKKAFELTIS